MRYSSLLFLLFFFLSLSVFAQSHRSIRIRAGEDIAKAYSPSGFYRFPSFEKATLLFKNGEQNKAQFLNYNILSGNMQFINGKGDTLEIAKPENIDSVFFDKDAFIYNDGFMEVVAYTDSILLLKKTTIKTQVEDIGAFGIPNSTGSIDNITRHDFYTNSNAYSFSLNQDIVINETVSWFFYMTYKKQTVKATKSNLLNLLSPRQRRTAETFIDKNKINFSKEEDLKKLFEDISQ